MYSSARRRFRRDTGPKETEPCRCDESPNGQCPDELGSIGALVTGDDEEPGPVLLLLLLLRAGAVLQVTLEEGLEGHRHSYAI